MKRYVVLAIASIELAYAAGMVVMTVWWLGVIGMLLAGPMVGYAVAMAEQYGWEKGWKGQF